MTDKVIGGEFQIDPFEALNIRDGDDHKSNSSMCYSLGRTAFYAILKGIQNGTYCESVLLPDYCCSSLVLSVKDAGLNACFYHIEEDLYPDWLELKQLVRNQKVILLINYFGSLELGSLVEQIRKENREIVIIEDDVQNFYRCGCGEVDFSFDSYRKWFPVPDGAKVNKFTERDYCLPGFEGIADYCDYKLAGNLMKAYSGLIDPKLFLNLLEKAEKMMDKEYTFAPSHVSIGLLEHLDVDLAAQIRKKNARKLHEGLEEIGIRHVFREDAVQLCVPIMFDDKDRRDKARKSMFESNVFCPVHWPVWSSKHNNSLYDRELSLICDQRYDADDMDRILEMLR